MADSVMDSDFPSRHGKLIARAQMLVEALENKRPYDFELKRLKALFQEDEEIGRKIREAAETFLAGD